ncbi:hypothetical protein BRADI_3g47652v3 [Brachypodium distachyon]|uniref:Uncharacterized protein n=1 Tax=Brachypodium distachyon TaxID=15368 RepID=A0A0Q3FPW7_BRADI|nr:hypothetical protein BRADI_3g47652v3 [Brachypodium distachyon]
MESRASLHDVRGHQTLRQNLDNTEKEIQISQAERSDVDIVSGMQMKELMGMIQKIEAEMEERLQVLLKQDRFRADLSAGLQRLVVLVVNAAKRFEGDELDAELNRLQGHSEAIRRVFDYSRDYFTKQVEKMQTMVTSLIAMTKNVDKLHEEARNAEIRAQGLGTMVSGMAQAQVAQVGMCPYGSAYNNLPASYEQTTQAGQSREQTTQAGMRSYGSTYNNLPYAYPYAYFPPAEYQQATQDWAYAYAVPYACADPMASHQAVQASGYAGYPSSGSGQNAVPYYPGYLAGHGQNQNVSHYDVYVAPQYPMIVNNGPTTDAANIGGNAGFPAGQLQTSGRAGTNVAYERIPPSQGRHHRG